MSLMSELTPAQQRVMDLAIKHYSVRESAKILKVKEHTIQEARWRAAVRVGMDYPAMVRALFDEYVRECDRPASILLCWQKTPNVRR